MQIIISISPLLLALDIPAIIICAIIGIVLYGESKRLSDPTQKAAKKRLAKKVILWPIVIAIFINILFGIAIAMNH